MRMLDIMLGSHKMIAVAILLDFNYYLLCVWQQTKNIIDVTRSILRQS